jgi:hypothetical protein
MFILILVPLFLIKILSSAHISKITPNLWHLTVRKQLQVLYRPTRKNAAHFSLYFSYQLNIHVSGFTIDSEKQLLPFGMLSLRICGYYSYYSDEKFAVINVYKVTLTLLRVRYSLKTEQQLHVKLRSQTYARASCRFYWDCKLIQLQGTWYCKSVWKEF